MKTLAVTLGALAWSTAAAAQSTRPAPPNCSAAEHRQFDFWVGDWDVVNPQGQPSGRTTW